MAKIGRPTTDTEPVTVRLPREVIEALDHVRRDMQDLPTRPEAIRRILMGFLLGRGLLDEAKVERYIDDNGKDGILK